MRWSRCGKRGLDTLTPSGRQAHTPNQPRFNMSSGFRAYSSILLLFLLASRAAAFGLAKDNDVYAQQLVDKTTRAHPFLYWVGIHAAPPGKADYVIIASTLDLIGKPSDPNDMDIGRSGVSLITPNAKKEKLGVMIPLKDRSGRIIGSLGMAFKYHEGDDQAEMYRKAAQIRDEIARDIPDHDSLFAKPSR